jgi:hypothetical protein
MTAAAVSVGIVPSRAAWRSLPRAAWRSLLWKPRARVARGPIHDDQPKTLTRPIEVNR